jgi:hypothetical protein
MSYTRLPMAMAEDGMLPRVLARRNRRGVPWVSVLLCAMAWALALKLPFERLISIDLILYGSSLLLEFVALAVLRIREPQLERPSKPATLLLPACWAWAQRRSSPMRSMSRAAKRWSAHRLGAAFRTAVGLLGPALYWLTVIVQKTMRAAPRLRSHQ